jgi:hypothetical protein
MKTILLHFLHLSHEPDPLSEVTCSLLDLSLSLVCVCVLVFAECETGRVCPCLLLFLTDLGLLPPAGLVENEMAEAASAHHW